MDLYLPADFHELRDAGIIDWRDARAAQVSSIPAENSSIKSDPDSRNACADPLWRVF